MLKLNLYEDNAYNWLKRKGLADKYEHAGIYCIRLNGNVIYIGKSHNMLRRIAQHYVGIKRQSERKYRVMAEAQRKGHAIEFDVLYYAKAPSYSAITNEIGEKEGEYIRQYLPPLNSQIPKAEDWHKFDVNIIDVKAVLDSIV